LRLTSARIVELGLHRVWTTLGAAS